MYSGRKEFCLELSPTPAWDKIWINTAHSYRLFQTTLTYVKPILHYVYGEGNGNPLQYSRLGNSTDRGRWLATVRGVAKSQIQLSAQARVQHLVPYLVVVNNLYSSFSSLSPPLFLFFFSFGCAALLAGSQFPNQGLNPGQGSESPESKPLGHQGTPPFP